MTDLTRDQDEETRDLLSLGMEVAGAMQSPWEPRSVVETFRAKPLASVVFTMQVWMELEAIRSPILMGELPEVVEEIEGTAAAFECDIEPLSEEEVLILMQSLRDSVTAAFGMRLKLDRPRRRDEVSEDEPEHGCGRWAPIWACLVSQCGLDPERAEMMEVGKAFVLIACTRINEGWRVAGETYAMRDVPLALAEEVARA